MVSRGLSRTEVNRRVRLVRQLFRWGTAQELVPSSILHGLEALTGLRRGRTVAPERKPVRPVHPGHVEAVIPFVAPPVAAMIRLQWWTGMRPAEVVQMRGCDLNTTGKIWEYRPQHHKLEHLDTERMIPIGPRAQDILRPWLRTNLAEYLFSPRESVEACWSSWGKLWKERRENRPESSEQANRSKDAAAVWAELRNRRAAQVKAFSEHFSGEFSGPISRVLGHRALRHFL